MQSLLKAQDALSRACFKIMIVGLPDDCLAWGTGFFISKDGLALTAYHNLPGKITRTGEGRLDIFYGNKQLKVDCLCTQSNADGDIAVLRLVDTRGLSIGFLQPGFFAPKSAHTERYQFWAGRSVCAYGFPSNTKILKDRFVDGNIDSGQPILKITEIDNDNLCEVVLKEVRRLQFVSLRSCMLYGISGAPVMDRESGLVVAVQGSYDPDCGIVYASEIGSLLDTWPEFTIYAVPLYRNTWRNTIRQQWPVKKGFFAHESFNGYLPILA